MGVSNTNDSKDIGTTAKVLHGDERGGPGKYDKVNVEDLSAAVKALLGGSLTVQELDGSPSGAATTLVLPNGTLSFVGPVATYTPPGGGGTITLTGDVTGSGSGSFAATIAANAVTYAKLQQSSAGEVVLTRANAAAGTYGETALAASQLLGRGPTGDITGIALGGGLKITAGTLTDPAVFPIGYYIPGIYKGFALRQLVPTYIGTGPATNSAFTARNTTTTTTKAIPFVQGTIDVDLTSLTTFAAGASCTISSLTEQSNNAGSNGLIQSTVANQPSIVTAGAIIPFGGTISRLAISTNGTTQWLQDGGGAGAHAQPITRATVMQFKSIASGQDFDSDGTGFSLFMSASGVLSSFAGVTQTIKSGVAVNDYAIIVECFSGAQSKFAYYSNGVTTLGTYSPGANTDLSTTLGAAAAGGVGTFANALTTEKILWNRILSDFEIAFYIANAAAYYGI